MAKKDKFSKVFNEAYPKLANGIQINIMDMSKFYEHVKTLVERGTCIELAFADAIAQFGKN